MFCSKCGKQIPDGAACDCTQNVQPQQTRQSQQQQTLYVQPYVKDPKTSCAKMSYILFFWLSGLFSAEYKDDALVRFHTGQSIILSVVTASLLVCKNVLFSVISYLVSMFGNISFSGFTISAEPTAVFVIKLLINLFILVFYIVFVCLGISAASKKILKPLPIIGKLAFYK